MEPLHNCRIKRYPDGSAEIVASSVAFGGGEVRRDPARYDDNVPTFWLPDWVRPRTPDEVEGVYASLERIAIQEEAIWTDEQRQRAAATRARAQRRARVAVRDLGLCNDWAYFVTLTLDPQRINRYDAGEVLRKLRTWLDNNVRRRGLAYVLVPEHHKDGAIHFHGFFNGALEAVDSGHRDQGGHTVYNLPRWGWGFSTAIRLYGERSAAVGYCCKYIAKQQEKIGGRWYYSGGALRRPEVEWLDVDFQALEAVEGAQPFTVPGLNGQRFLVLTTSANWNDFTISGKSSGSAAPGAAAAPAPGGAGMTPEKPGEGSEANDHGVPAESGVGARSGGSDAAKCPDHGNRFTDRAAHLGRPGAAHGAASDVHVGGGKKDWQETPVRSDGGPAAPDQGAGGAGLGVPGPEERAAQDPAGRLDGRETGRQGVPD